MRTSRNQKGQRWPLSDDRVIAETPPSRSGLRIWLRVFRHALVESFSQLFTLGTSRRRSGFRMLPSGIP